MKGKVSFYFNAPNTQKVRTRLQNPSAEFSKKMRNAIQESIIETVNENTYATRAKLIKKFQDMGEIAKDKTAAAALASPLNAFFDVFASATNEGGDAEGGDAEGGDADPDEAPAAPAKGKKEDDTFED